MTATKHPVDVLWDELAALPYPPGVVPVPRRIQGVSFFPGGAGLWMSARSQPLPPMPVGRVMVLGHDFYSEAGYTDVLANDDAGALLPSKARTWPNLRGVLRQVADGEVSVTESDCFFTNVYMGLRKQDKNTGKFPGANCPRFVEACRGFLRKQLLAQRPRVILLLGAAPLHFVAQMSDDLIAWRGEPSLRQVDASGTPVRHDVSFAGMGQLPRCSLVALTHPCCRNANAGARLFGDHSGNAAEIAMIRQALRRAGLSRATAGETSPMATPIAHESIRS